MANMLTVDDLIRKLHISKTSCYSLLKIKGFPQIKIGRSYLVNENELEEWLKNNRGSHIIL